MDLRREESLIGVIDAGTRTIKFCVFRSEHTKEIAEHTINIATHTPEEGWSEQDPKEILNAVKTCMKNVVDELGPKGKIYLSLYIIFEQLMNPAHNMIFHDGNVFAIIFYI